MRTMRISGILASSAVAALLLLFHSVAEARLVFSFDVAESYDDNVIGLVQDNPNTGGGAGGGGFRGGMYVLPANQRGLNDNPGGTGTGTGTGTATDGSRSVQRGDFSTSLFADLGSRSRWGDHTEVLVLAAVSYTAYAVYDEFDFTVGSVSAGVTRRFSEVLSGKCSLKAAAKNFGNNLRNATAYGASAGFKETVNNSVWFKQAYEFERNRADVPLYSYDGHAGTAWIGLSLAASMSLELGYGYLSRWYEAPEDFTVTTQSLSAFLAVDLNDAWSFSAGYDHEMADSNVPDTATTNNRYSLGFRYDY